MTDALNTEARAREVLAAWLGPVGIATPFVGAINVGYLGLLDLVRQAFAADPTCKNALQVQEPAFARPADDAAVLAEREACARVADKSKIPVPQYSENPQQDFQRTVAPIINQTSSAIAIAIRARSDAAGEAK